VEVHVLHRQVDGVFLSIGNAISVLKVKNAEAQQEQFLLVNHKPQDDEYTIINNPTLIIRIITKEAAYDPAASCYLCWEELEEWKVTNTDHLHILFAFAASPVSSLLLLIQYSPASYFCLVATFD
jgi:hypothetical protein